MENTEADHYSKSLRNDEVTVHANLPFQHVLWTAEHD